MSDQQPRRARHLMDPSNPRPPQQTGGGMSLDGVQKWVMSTLAATTILHLAGGMVLSALVIDDQHLDAVIGLNILGGIFGVLAVVAARAIHQKPLLSWWLLLGFTPAVIGLYLAFG